jgi:hypothetical protein
MKNLSSLARLPTARFFFGDHDPPRSTTLAKTPPRSTTLDYAPPRSPKHQHEKKTQRHETIYLDIRHYYLDKNE